MPPIKSLVCTRAVIIPALDPDTESDFQLFGDSGSGFRSRKKRNHNVLSFWDSIRSQIFSLLMFLNPDLDPVKSGNRNTSSLRLPANESSEDGRERDESEREMRVKRNETAINPLRCGQDKARKRTTIGGGGRRRGGLFIVLRHTP